MLLFTIDAGGGHRAAARALVAAAEETGAPFRFRVESFQEVLLPLDVLKRATGVSLEAAYNLILQAARQRPDGAAAAADARRHPRTATARSCARSRTGCARQPRPEAVVSVFPNFNGVLRDAMREAIPGVPLVVVLTDLADFPPRFWIEPGLDRVVVGTPKPRRRPSRSGSRRNAYRGSRA